MKIIFKDKKQYLVALLCIVLVFSVVWPCRTMSIFWGDDWAAYLSDGIALAKGTYAEKTQLNAYMHPAAKADDPTEGNRVYVWGFPLMQALVYQMFGFDRTDFHTIVLYQLPGTLCLSLLSGVLYLFFRRRFQPSLSIVLSLFFCLNQELLLNVRSMYSDIPFLFFVMLSFYLAEENSAAIRQGHVRLLPLVFEGCVLWYMWEIRANGVVIIATVTLARFLVCGKGWKKRKNLFSSFFPICLAFLLKLVFEHFILYSPTPDIGSLNLSDLGAVLLCMKRNIRLFLNWFVSFPLVPGGQFIALSTILFAFFVLISVLGACSSAKTNLPYILFAVGTFFFLSITPYMDFRYFFPILVPCVLLTVEGLKWLYQRFFQKSILHLRLKKISTPFAVLLCMVVLVGTLLSGRAVPLETTGPYSSDAIDMYHFIQANTPEDAVIAFIKPRALYLNTQRLSFTPQAKNHSTSEADYYLYDSYYYSLYIVGPTAFDELMATNNLTEVYNSGNMTLFRIVR